MKLYDVKEFTSNKRNRILHLYESLKNKLKSYLFFKSNMKLYFIKCIHVPK
jgi:hypothetical protein